MSPDHLERLDRVVDQAKQRLGAVGGAAAVVAQGMTHVVGWGLADAEAGTPAGSRTIFRMGSTSKLVTATAAMQLVEQGRLVLDADVNLYLEAQLQIPRKYRRPVTLRNLLTHTAGFEENQLGYMVKRSAADLLPLAQHLASHRPAQVRPPTTDFSDGRGASYSNWGMALVGHIVASVAKQTFEDYVEENIFRPLAMTRSTFREPLPASLACDLSMGYSRDEKGELRKHGFEFFSPVGPAGSMSSTAEDQARFMRAHLGERQDGRNLTLRRETALLMQSRVLSPHPAVNGGGLGFYEMNIGGRRTVGHQGATTCFVSQLVLIPEAGLGLFVVLNTRTAPRRLQELVRALVESLLPARPIVQKSITPTSLDRYAGSYLALPHSHSRLEKFLLLAQPNYEMKVTATPRATLRISNLACPREWAEIAAGVFQQEGSQEVVAFVDDASGRVSHMVGPAAFVPAYRLESVQTPGFHRALLMQATTGFHIGLAWRAIVRSGSRPDRGRVEPALELVAAVAALNLAGLSLVWDGFAGGGVSLVYEYPKSVHEGRRLIRMASELTATLLGLVLRAWVHEEWTQAERQGIAGFTALSAAFLGSLDSWNVVP